MSTLGMAEPDWVNLRGVATEPHIDQFVSQVGGQRVNAILSKATHENADYLFDKEKVVIELKIVETEFKNTESFQIKEQNLIAELAQKFSFGEIVRGELPVRIHYASRKREMYRAPLARIAKKANRQIRETKKALGRTDLRGVLWLVNDNFRAIGTDFVMATMGQILMGSYSEIRAFLYVTNHYVEVQGNEYANLIWAPTYADADTDTDLPDFINHLGGLWHDYIETQLGPFDSRTVSEETSILRGARPITEELLRNRRS